MAVIFSLIFFFWFKTCHNYFIEDLGLPTWGSYTVFALATLLSGLLLGLVSSSFLEYWEEKYFRILRFNIIALAFYYTFRFLCLFLQFMIFVADCLCPSKRRRPQPYPSSKYIFKFFVYCNPIHFCNKHTHTHNRLPF